MSIPAARFDARVGDRSRNIIESSDPALLILRHVQIWHDLT